MQKMIETSVQSSVDIAIQPFIKALQEYIQQTILSNTK
jgi:hypothetical protein